MPDTGEVVRSCLKPIGKPYQSTAIDTNKDAIISAEVEPATQEEIDATVTVMGGEDWELWINALEEADVLAEAVSLLRIPISAPILHGRSIGMVL